MMRTTIGACALALAGTALFAAEIVYDGAAGETDLAKPAAWQGGVAPGASDVAVFDGAAPGTLSLGAETAWAGVVRTNAASALTLQAPVGGRLLLGAAGCRIHASDDAFARLNFDVDVALAADQTWIWERNKSPCLKRALAGSGALTLDVYPNEWNVRQGNCVFEGAVSAAVAPKDGVRLFLLGEGAFERAPALGKNAGLVLVPGAAAGAFAFADLVASRTLVNGGYLHFGNVDTDKAYTAFTNTFTLAAGDRIEGPDEDTSDRQKGHLRVQDAHVVADGADVAGVWFNLRSGTWTQKSGATAFAYGATVGRGACAGYGLSEQRLVLEGGTFAARRLTVGLGNGDAHPAEVCVAGGAYTGTRPDEADQWWATGLALAPRTAQGESKWEGSQEVAFTDSEYAAGRLEIAGGTVRTPAVLFGNDNNAWGKHDARSGARVALSGGRLEVGAGGFRTAAAWRDDAAMDGSWYEAVLSGGTLAFYRPGTVSSADLRLSGRAGGATIEVPSGTVVLSGALYGEGGFRKTGAGALLLRGANDYTGRTEVVEGRLAAGDRYETAVWTADACAEAEGAPVAAWTAATASDAVWTFGPAGTIPNTDGTTAPVLRRGALNGHDALAFNGESACFLTGATEQPQPISGQSAFTVALVFQTEKDFAGAASENVWAATQLFGTSIEDTWNAGQPCSRLYGLALDAQGRVGCGMFGGRWTEGTELKEMDAENLWSTTRVNDGKPHVVVWTWSWKGEHVLRVDDAVFRLASPSNGVKSTFKTRIVLGVGERQAAPLRRFKGLLADLRMVNAAVSDARGERLARELGVRYGVAAYAGARLWRAADAPARAEPPDPTASWTADALDLPAGASVENWAEDAGRGAGSGTPWTFSRALADSILKPKTGTYPGTTESPVLVADARTGRSFVSFNGRTACLALTGSVKTPVGGGDGLTAALVVRFTGRGRGGGAFGPADAAPFFGSAYGMDAASGNENWQILLSGASRLGFAHRWGGQNPETVRARPRFLDDGEAHVVVARLPRKGTDDALALFVDGVKAAAPAAVSGVVHNTRILLGGSEYGGARYAPVDVAAIRLWSGCVLTDEQVATLSADLAARYGVSCAAATRGAAEAGQSRSQTVFVHAGASFGDVRGATLFPGQTLEGGGTAVGPLTLAPGAALKTTAAEAPACANGLMLMDGAVLAAEGASFRPLEVAGNVVFEGSVVVRLAAPDGARPTGTLLSWTGVCSASPSAVFAVEGPLAARVCAKLDAARRRLVLAPTGGSVLLVR